MIPEKVPVAQQVIPVYRPDLSGNERAYVLDCLDSSWISSIGKYVDRFEADMAAYVKAEQAVSVCNGTVALHLALHCLGIGPGDEVIVPTFTYIASVNTIAQTGATPVFADSRASDWLLDVEDVRRRITPRTKAIVAVHLYGLACDMPALRQLADAHGLRIVEDCAEALGTTLDGQHLGTFGDVGTFSFFGNKTVTTGEGGMVVTRDHALGQQLRQVKGQGQSFTRRYWHEMLGFNYRMTNIAAAIGCAQMERVADLLQRKRALAKYYREQLSDIEGLEFQAIDPRVNGSDWLVSLLLPPGVRRDALMESMRGAFVDTRPVFFCAHEMPMYQVGEHFPVAEEISSRGISLPSYPGLTERELEIVIGVLRRHIALNS